MVHLWKNGHPRKLMTLMKTIFWSLSRQTVFLQNLLNHIKLLFCGISDTSNSFFFKGILPLYVCSIFTGFLLTKSSFCTSTSFFKSCKNRGWSFCRPQCFPGRLRASGATILPQSPSSLIPGIVCQTDNSHNVKPYFLSAAIATGILS